MLWILFSLLAIYIESSLYSPRLMYQTGFLLLFTKKDVSAVRTKTTISTKTHFFKWKTYVKAYCNLKSSKQKYITNIAVQVITCTSIVFVQVITCTKFEKDFVQVVT